MKPVEWSAKDMVKRKTNGVWPSRGKHVLYVMKRYVG